MSNGIVSTPAAPAAQPRSTGTLLLSRSDVERLLTPDECIAAVEDAFPQHGLGNAPPPGILGLHAHDGGFHIKAALLTLDRPYFAAGAESAAEIVPVADLPQAVAASDIVITCTTAQRYFVTREMVRPGTFVAGTGADNENKQELDPLLLARSKLVTDITGQCAVIGDLRHALAAGAMSRADVHAELGEIVAGRRPGRTRDDEIIVFDSTGTALQDVAAAVAVYRRALEQAGGLPFSFDA